MRAFRIFCGEFVTQAIEGDVCVAFMAFLCVMFAKKRCLHVRIAAFSAAGGFAGGAASIV